MLACWVERGAPVQPMAAASWRQHQGSALMLCLGGRGATPNTQQPRRWGLARLGPVLR